jgi:hypothetical protein
MWSPTIVHDAPHQRASAHKFQFLIITFIFKLPRRGHIKIVAVGKGFSLFVFLRPNAHKVYFISPLSTDASTSYYYLCFYLFIAG